MADETSPLLGDMFNEAALMNQDQHAQFCMLMGIPPSDMPKGAKFPLPNPNLLYTRARKRRAAQNRTYIFTASLSNTLLLSQVVLGAALTGLGASESSHILITVFGALNTVIAGLVAYLKSRGQPMRARVFRDDLERVVDEIENSEIMWLGISKRVHGYDEIDTDDEVSVRSEVARLTRLYDRAVRNNTANNPDMYMSNQGGDPFQGLRARPLPGQTQLPPVTPAVVADSPAAVPPNPSTTEDESPATAPTPNPTQSDAMAAPKSEAPQIEPSAASTLSKDPDESPATAANVAKRKEDSNNTEHGRREPAESSEI